MIARQKQSFAAAVDTCATIYAKTLTWMAVKGRFAGNTASSGACLLKPGDNPASKIGATGMPSYCTHIDSVVERRLIVDTSSCRSEASD